MFLGLILENKTVRIAFNGGWFNVVDLLTE